MIDKVNFKGVKFYPDQKAEVKEGTVVKFYYGVTNLSPMIGKVRRVFDKGVEVYNEGFYMAPWDRITKIWVPKKVFKYSPTRLNVEKHHDMLPYVDGILDSIKAKFEHAGLTIEDKRIDLSTRFNRNLKIKGKNQKYVMISIDNKSEKLEIDENGKKYKYKLNFKYMSRITALIVSIEKALGLRVECNDDEEERKIDSPKPSFSLTKKSIKKSKNKNSVCQMVIDIIKKEKKISHKEVFNRIISIFPDKKYSTVNNTITFMVWKNKNEINKKKIDNETIYEI